MRVLQRKLYRAAKAAPRRTFGVLYDKVYRRDVLGEAWQRVRRNRGSAGIDKQTIAEVEAQGVDRILDELEGELREKRNRPMPIASRGFPLTPSRAKTSPKLNHLSLTETRCFLVAIEFAAHS